jgi:ABC-type lipoprotein release transport system permease subunit
MRLMDGAISGLLYELAPSDSRNILVAVGVMLATAITASVVPACRAASVDPNSAIRSE